MRIPLNHRSKCPCEWRCMKSRLHLQYLAKQWKASRGFAGSPTLHASSDMCSKRKGQAMTSAQVPKKEENELEMIFFHSIQDDWSLGPQKDSQLSMLMSVSLKCSSGLWRDCLKSHTAAQHGLLSAPYFTGSRGAMMRCFISCWMIFFFFSLNRTQATRSCCLALRETGTDGQTLIYRTGGWPQAWMYACIHTHRHTHRE